MIDKIIKDLGNEQTTPKHYEEYVDELLDKINKIIEWINEQNN